MKVQSAIFFGPILMIDVDGVYLPVALATLSAKTYLSSSIIQTILNWLHVLIS